MSAAAQRPAADPAVAGLTDLGLTPNEARCYVSLLEIAPATAARIADATGVPRPKVYGAMESLAQRGFCAVGAERVATYRPVAPDLALGEWLRRREHDRRVAAQRDDVLRGQLVAALPAPADGGPERLELMRAVLGVERTAEAFEGLVRGAERRMDIVQAPPFVQPRGRWNLLEAEAARRGVEVRVLLTPDAVDDPGRRAGLLEAGVGCRVAASLTTKMIVRDGVEAVVALRHPERMGHGFVAVHLQLAELVAPLQLVFQREWRRATPLSTTTEEGDHGRG